MSVSSMIGMLLLLAPLQVVLAQEVNCLPEFDTCVMNRDCCGNDIECVAGKWEVTTDSTCLSARSKIMGQFSRMEQIEILKDFYDNKVPSQNRKSTAEVVKMYDKHARRFPKLVARLEEKYELAMTIPNPAQGDEL